MEKKSPIYKSLICIIFTRRVHLQALAKMRLPRDYMSEITGKHFTYSSVNDKEVSFVLAHKTACDLLSEVRPVYSDRRLGSQVGL